MKLSRFSFALLIALLLVFAQQAGVVHALKHFGDSRATHEQQKHLPGEKACNQCLAFATIAGAAKSDTAQFNVADGHDELSHYAFLSVASLEATPYLSRAPPADS